MQQRLNWNTQGPLQFVTNYVAYFGAVFAIQLLARVVDDGFLGTGDGKGRLPLGSSMKGDMYMCVYVCVVCYS